MRSHRRTLSPIDQSSTLPHAPEKGRTRPPDEPVPCRGSRPNGWKLQWNRVEEKSDVCCNITTPTALPPPSNQQHKHYLSVTSAANFLIQRFPLCLQCILKHCIARNFHKLCGIVPTCIESFSCKLLHRLVHTYLRRSAVMRK